MKTYTNYISQSLQSLIIIALLLLSSCGQNGDKADAYGNFESDDVTISAEANGRLIYFDLEEGSNISAGDEIGLIDTTQLYIQKNRIIASMQAVRSKTLDVESEIAVFKEQWKNLDREYRRVQNLFKKQAATQKQLDDIKGQLDVVNKQLQAAETKLKKANTGILSEINPLKWQLQQVEDQILKSRIINPVSGTVIAKYVEKDEVVGFGVPLYKIADLESVYLRAYISEPQLAGIEIGNEVTVAIDNAKETREYPGKVTWISDVAEFTPKVIQTKEERANLVYAMKVAVKNDGSIKLGMPGEVWIQTNESKEE